MKTSIIALGNSLRGFDFDTILGHKIVLNNGYKYVKYDINVWFDEPPAKLFDPNHNLETLYCWGGLWKHNGRELNRETNYTVSSFNSSLILAINIALKMGFKEIDIYGADGYVKDYVHFYDKQPVANPEYHNNQMASINNMLQKLKFKPDEKVTFIDV